MRKIINKFISILILITMAVQIILPITVYADETTPEAEETYEVVEFVPKATAWYKMNYDNPEYLEKTSTTVEDTIKYYEKIYYIENGVKRTPSIDRNNPQVYLTKGKTYYRPKEGWWGNAKADLQPPTTVKVANSLKAMVADFFYSIGNAMHYLIGVALGKTVTIDDVVFNNYAEVNISFFDKEDEVAEGMASPLIYGNNGVGGLNSVVNEWYGIFRQIALIGYMMILVYMGIKILLTASADEKANYKKFFMDWLIGITILMLFPYAMRYIIDINEAMVETIEANKGYEDSTSSSLKNADYDKKLSSISIDDEIDWGSGTDYMSKIAQAAKILREPAISFAFIIMTWQLIVLVAHYYKRLFMIAFLIVIFPLVALSYALDKIADSKSQALDTWLKEYMLNVFVQTFHAIVYVFACSTFYSAAGINSSEVGFDFILIIVGVTFLFKGEEIIRQIFGQISKAGTMGGLKDSAALTFAKFAIAKNILKKTSEVTVGKKSIPRKLVRGVNQMRAIDAREKAFDKTAKKQEDYNTGLRLDGAPKDPGENASEEEKKNFLKERDIFNAAAILNNPKTHSLEEKANALNTLKEVAVSDPNHMVFNSTKMSPTQIAALSALDRDVEHMISSGMNRLDIERKVELRMFDIFPEANDDVRKDRTKTYYTALYLNAGSTISKSNINYNVEKTIRAIEREDSNIRYGNKRGLTKEKLEQEADNISSRYLEKHKDTLTDAEKAQVREMAKDIVILNRRGKGEFSSNELLKTVDNIRNHAYDNEAVRQMVEESVDSEVDIDALAHIIAKNNLSKKNIDTSSAHYELAKRIATDYEADTRDGYFKDEISIHELIKEKDNKERLKEIVEEVYENKKVAQEESGLKAEIEDFAKQYLVDRSVDIMEGSYDTTLELQDGYTKEELKVMKINAALQMFSDIAAVNKTSVENGGLVGHEALKAKEYLERVDEERTGIHRMNNEPNAARWEKIQGRMKTYRKRLAEVKAKDIVEDRRKEREKIQEKHFYGDIWDKK